MVNQLNTGTQNSDGTTTRLTVYGRVGHHGDCVVVGEGGQLAEVGGREARWGEGGRGGREGGEGGGGEG